MVPPGAPPAVDPRARAAYAKRMTDALALALALTALAALVAALVMSWLRRPEIGHREVFEAMQEPALVVGPDGTVLQANPAAVRLVDETEVAAVRGRSLMSLAPQLENARRAQGRTNEPRLLGGDMAGYAASITQLRDRRRRLRASVIVVHDGRQDRDREQRLREEANSDPLTSAANRAGFEEALRGALANRDAGNIGLVYIDLDDFKPVNDTHGHAVGDMVLVEVVRRLRHASRSHDVIGRLGGDEFALLITNVTPEGLAHVAERVREAAATPIQAGSLTLRVGFSLGLASAPRDGRDAASLLEAADARMYRDKQAKLGRAPRESTEAVPEPQNTPR